jgi:hypothetical protein
MADKTIRLGYRQMRALHYLGVAGGTSQFFPSSQLFQVKGVIKDHVLEKDAVSEVFPLVTPFLETARVTDHGMGFARMFAGYEIGQ